MKDIKTEKLPIKFWVKEIEEAGLQQAKNMANLPFAIKNVAIQASAHLNYGNLSGSVIALKDAVIPNAVGADIGCGICAVNTNLSYIEKPVLWDIADDIKKNVPMGFKFQKNKAHVHLMPAFHGDMRRELPTVFREYQLARQHVGTLGGGNHFIEIQKGSDGNIWIMVHSGSKNLGFKVAGFYNYLAKKHGETSLGEVPSEFELAYFRLDSREAQNYLREMKYCIDFAKTNRKLILERVAEAFYDNQVYFDITDMIDCTHNFVSIETHYKEEVVVHRRGASQAKKDQLAIIPGSQGTKSYIVKGKGSKPSFESCSNGAGRILERKKAPEILDLGTEISKLKSQGIIHSIEKKRDLDEASAAYRNIDEVIKNQKTLFTVEIELQPLVVLKG